MAKGTYKQIMRNPKSLTGAYFPAKSDLAIPIMRRSLKKGKISINNASKNNLKNINVDIPLGALTCLTGVSGSGKSTLLTANRPARLRIVRFESERVNIEGATVTGLSQFDKVISIDQNPIGHTVRSDVGTYTDVLTRIREFFACFRRQDERVATRKF